MRPGGVSLPEHIHPHNLDDRFSMVFSRIRQQGATQQAHGGRLARPIRTDQPIYLTRVNLKADVIDGNGRTE